ncbi:methyltransferase domain-containing protein [Vibrio breoganii]
MKDVEHAYNDDFFRYINKGSELAAEAIIPIIKKHFVVDSVLDVGCGSGTWLKVWKEHNIEDVYGIDGNSLKDKEILVPRKNLLSMNLCSSFNLDRRFTVTQCLEVAEHIPQKYSLLLVESICKHSDIVIFSAAPPGQGGENHVNEQCYDYWRNIFKMNGFDAYDIIRPKISGLKSIPPWYKYNLLIYIRDTSNYASLLDAYRQPYNKKISDISPWRYKTRKRLISLLPVEIATLVAKVKKRLTLIFR